MNTIQCIYPDRDAVLAGYLYDDIDQTERIAFDSHLTACRLCSDELAGLRGVRETLGGWAPPEPARTFSSFEPRGASHEMPSISHDPRGAWWHQVPVWAQVAAAMLVLGASASIANLDIRYDRAGGLSVRTGWSRPAQVAAQTAAPAPVAKAAQDVAKATQDEAPWRADLAALQSEMRSELRAAKTDSASTVQSASAASAGDSMSDAELRRRARVLLDESEKRQTNQLALRVAELQKDYDSPRQADLTKINQNLGSIQRDTYGELLKQREGVNYLLKVSQKQ